MALFLVLFFVILALVSLVWTADLRTTVAFVIGKGGFWLEYSSGVGRLRFFGFQIRMMNGRRPRAWMRVPLTGRLKEVDFGETIREMTEPKWKPIHIPLRGFFDIGVHIVIDELNASVRLGLEDDAAATALLCGGISTLLQALRAVSTRGQFVPEGKVSVRPAFGETCLSIRFKCILAIKARHIIREVIESLARRGGNGRSSDRKHHANHHGEYPQHG